MPASHQASSSKTDIGLNECIVSNHSPPRKLRSGLPGSLGLGDARLRIPITLGSCIWMRAVVERTTTPVFSPFQTLPAGSSPSEPLPVCSQTSSDKLTGRKPSRPASPSLPSKPLTPQTQPGPLERSHIFLKYAVVTVVLAVVM